MKSKFALLIFLVISLLSAHFVCTTQASNGDSKQSIDRRTLQFPSDQPVGRLFTHDAGLSGSDLVNDLCLAKGKVSVPVERGHILVLALNAYTIDHPDILLSVSPQGLDGLEMNRMAMTEQDGIAFARALTMVPHFQDIVYLSVKRSDARDDSMKILAKLPKLRYFDCFDSGITGSYFDKFALTLSDLSIGRSPLRQSCLSSLAKLPRLTYLNLDHTGLQPEGLTNVCKCKHLKILILKDNPAVTDSGVQHLLALKELEKLDLRGTNVTSKGMDNLSTMKLKLIKLPKTIPDLAFSSLKKRMPGTYIERENTAPSKEVQSIWGSLK